jgi:hypothetical protein
VNYSIEYFHYRVSTEIESWPDGILADYVRILELLMEFGPNLRMPHSRAMGGGVFEMRPHSREGIWTLDKNSLYPPENPSVFGFCHNHAYTSGPMCFL